MVVQDIVVKKTQPLRIAEASAAVPGYGSDTLGPFFGELYPRVVAQIERSGARPGMCVAWYAEDDNGAVTLHAGFEIADQNVSAGNGVNIVDMPVVDVASVVYHGSMDNVGSTYEALTRWIETSGYRLAGQSRELYYKWCEEDHSQNITEIQFPVTKG